ncbi:MAG: hypothetical protein DI537_10120 [Stutzerimonas stutzeri]|nr:MAG: hypothetical protein DI537_10120 [Stutzerimonas stutzeri]
MLAFEIEDCEFQFGDVSIAGDICLCLEGDGSEFTLTHCFVDNKPAESWLFERMATWIELDLKNRGEKSRVRIGFAERAAAARGEGAANLADHLRELHRLAA